MCSPVIINNGTYVRVDFFKSSGKWYTTEWIKWTGPYYGSFGNGELKRPAALIHDAFMISLHDFAHYPGGMRAVCLEPYHEHAHPISVESNRQIITECYEKFHAGTLYRFDTR